MLQWAWTFQLRDRPVPCPATTCQNRNLAELLGQSFRILRGYHVHATGEHQERGWSMTEQVPKDLTEAEVVDRLEVGRPEDEGDGSSEVDRWDDEGGHDRAG
jgi:hypothetical protein